MNSKRSTRRASETPSTNNKRHKANKNKAETHVSPADTDSAAPLHNYWILKPVGLSRGRGISLLKSLDELAYSQASVVQKYVERPLCLSHYKFDLRIYVVVTSFRPLEAFVYRDGFARATWTTSSST